AVVGELFLVGLVILGQQITLREVFPNASPVLWGLLQFGLSAPQSYLAMLGFGAVCGLLGAGLALLSQRYRGPVIVGVVAVIMIGLLEDLIGISIASNPLFATSPAVETLNQFFLAQGVESGLTAAGAVVAFLAASTLAYFWPSLRGGARSRTHALPARRRHILLLVAYGVFVAFLLILPNFLGPYLTDVSNLVIIFTLMALGLNIVVGFAGLLDLGYVAFFAIGAYTMGVLTTTAVGGGAGQITWGPGFSFWAALPFAVFFSLMAGVLLGIPVLRMRGDYLAIVTLGFGEIVRILALSDALKSNIGGSQGIVEPAVPTLGRLTEALASQQVFYYLLLACVVLVIFIAIRLRDSRQGRSWMAVREDEDVAQAVGVRLVSTKLLAFASGAAMAGLAGAVFASKVGSIYPHSFDLLKSINVLAIVIVGGMGSIPGVILGALVLFGMPEILREFSEYRYFVFGALLVAMMLTRPEGLWPSSKRKQELHEGFGPEADPPPEPVAAPGGAGSA
ncbi:MAG: Leucine/isoleucine/valine transporter permease subunit, partial [Anaerolineales bacterium]|nr:Leucine/isoleucine/valine transporter permease subunit [Anaerolineales bacterium]